MKKRIIFSLAALLVAMATVASSVNKFTVATGKWSATATWSLTRGGASGAVAPGMTDTVYITNGFTDTVDASGKTCYNLIVETGGTLITNTTNPTSSQRYIRVYGDTVRCDGYIGVTSGAPTTYTALAFEACNTGKTVRFVGTGTCIPSRIRTNTGYNGVTTMIDMNVTLSYQGSTGAGGICWYSVNTRVDSASVLKINTGRTLTLLAFGYIGGGATGSIDEDGAGASTIQVDGTITTGSNGTMGLRPNATADVNLIVNGLVDIGRTLKPTSLPASGSRNAIITVNSGGELKVGTAGGGTCYFYSPTIAVTGLGKFTLGANSTLQVGATAGLDATSGPIQTIGLNTLPQGAKYEYNGSLAQVTGAQLPGEINGLTITNPAGLTLTNNLVVDTAMTFNNGTLSLGGKTFGYGTTSARLTYADSLAVTTSNVEFPGDGKVQTLIINKTAAVIPANFGNVTLHAARTVDSLRLTNGNLVTTGTNLLTLSANKAVPVSGGSVTSFVSGPLAYANAATGAFSKTYPIGKGSIYRPVTLSLTQADVTPSTYTAEMINSAPAANGFPGTLSQTEPNTASKVRYYTISENGGGSTFIAGTVTISYGADEAVTDTANLSVAQGPVAGGGTWTDLAGSGSAKGTGTILSTSFFTALTNTAFTLANKIAGTNPLPVEMTSFTAITKGRGVELVWSTATEVNNMGFEIEKNVKGSWSKIAFVEGSGTTNTQHAYSYVDANVFGKMQYRLKQIDRDGKFSYSNTVEAVVALTAEDYKLGQNYPNPFNPTTNIYFALKNTEHATVTIYNMLGQHVATLFNGEATANQMYSLTFDAKELSSGIYFYSLQSATRNEVKKMMLMK